MACIRRLRRSSVWQNRRAAAFLRTPRKSLTLSDQISTVIAVMIVEVCYSLFAIDKPEPGNNAISSLYLCFNRQSYNIYRLACKMLRCEGTFRAAIFRVMEDNLFPREVMEGPSPSTLCPWWNASIYVPCLEEANLCLYKEDRFLPTMEHDYILMSKHRPCRTLKHSYSILHRHTYGLSFRADGPMSPGFST